jgi:hypothetical protein
MTDTASAWTNVSINDPLAPEAAAILFNKYSKPCNSNWAWAIRAS